MQRKAIKKSTGSQRSPLMRTLWWPVSDPVQLLVLIYVPVLPRTANSSGFSRGGVRLICTLLYQYI